MVRSHTRGLVQAGVVVAIFMVPSPCLANGSDGPTRALVSVSETNLYKYAGGTFYAGLLKKRQSFDIERMSPGGWAWGYAHGHASKCAWVKAADVGGRPAKQPSGLARRCGSPPRKPATQKPRFVVHVANSGAGGGGPTFHIGSPINITIRDRDSRSTRRLLRLCLTPAPIDRPSCRSGHVNRVIATLAPSKAGTLTIRATIDDGPTLIRKITVRAVR